MQLKVYGLRLHVASYIVYNNLHTFIACQKNIIAIDVWLLSMCMQHIVIASCNDQLPKLMCSYGKVKASK